MAGPGSPQLPNGARILRPGRPPATSRAAAPTGLSWRDGSLPGPRWEQAVAEAVGAIRMGALRKVVLARDVFATADEPIDTRVLLRRLALRYPDCFTFSCDGMIGATPELLVRRAADQPQRAGTGRHAAARDRPGTGQGAGRGTAGLGEEQRGARLRGRLDTRGARATVPGIGRRGATVPAEVPEPAAPRHPGTRRPGRRHDAAVGAGAGRRDAPAGCCLRHPAGDRARADP